MGDRHDTDRHPDILDDVPMKAADEPPGWADSPAFRNRVIWGLYGLCAILILIDPLIHKHGAFEIKGSWGALGMNWMLSAALLVVGGAVLARLHIRASNQPKGKIVDTLSVLLTLAALGIMAAMAVLDPLVSEKGRFAVEHWWGFYAIYGLIGSVFAVLVAKEMRRVIMMPERYYEELEGLDDDR